MPAVLELTLIAFCWIATAIYAGAGLRFGMLRLHYAAIVGTMAMTLVADPILKVIDSGFGSTGVLLARTASTCLVFWAIALMLGFAFVRYQYIPWLLAAAACGITLVTAAITAATTDPVPSTMEDATTALMVISNLAWIVQAILAVSSLVALVRSGAQVQRSRALVRVFWVLAVWLVIRGVIEVASAFAIAVDPSTPLRQWRSEHSGYTFTLFMTLAMMASMVVVYRQYRQLRADRQLQELEGLWSDLSAAAGGAPAHIPTSMVSAEALVLRFATEIIDILRKIGLPIPDRAMDSVELRHHVALISEYVSSGVSPASHRESGRTDSAGRGHARDAIKNTLALAKAWRMTPTAIETTVSHTTWRP